MRNTALKTTMFTMFAAACVLNTGCRTTQSPKFYALQPVQSANESITNVDPYKQGVIDLGPIIMPEHLGKSQIAVVGEGPEIYYSDLNRWSSSLDENFLNVLTQNVRSMLPEFWIAKFQSLNDAKSDYSVGIHITKFDGTPGSSATLNVQWAVFSDNRKKVCRMRSETFRKNVPAKTYASLVETQSQLLAELSKCIVADIQAVKKENPVPVEKSKEEAGK